MNRKLIFIGLVIAVVSSGCGKKGIPECDSSEVGELIDESYERFKEIHHKHGYKDCTITHEIIGSEGEIAGENSRRCEFSASFTCVNKRGKRVEISGLSDDFRAVRIRNTVDGDPVLWWYGGGRVR